MMDEARSGDRFVKIYRKGFSNVNEIYVDRETGVNYLFHSSGYAGGLCVMVDKDGRPLVTDPYTLEHDRD